MSDEAQILQGLNLGSSKAIFEGAKSSPLTELLEALTNDVISELIKATDARNINASRNLSQSILPTAVEVKGSSVSVGISMPFYWKYVNYGVNGTEINHGAPSWGSAPAGQPSFKQAILHWITDRGAQLPPSFDNYESFAWAIMTNVRKHGKAPRPFFNDVVNPKLVETLRSPIEKLLGRAVEINIVAPWQ